MHNRRACCVVAVFKVNVDPNLDDEDVDIPTANMSSSGGGYRAAVTTRDAAADNIDDDDDDDFGNF